VGAPTSRSFSFERPREATTAVQQRKKISDRTHRLRPSDASLSATRFVQTAAEKTDQEIHLAQDIPTRQLVLIRNEMPHSA
jgi:hypothetical protein